VEAGRLFSKRCLAGRDELPLVRAESTTRFVSAADERWHATDGTHGTYGTYESAASESRAFWISPFREQIGPERELVDEL
jgi:hypothetical protein